MRKITAIAGSLLSTTALVSGTAAVTSAHEGETTRTLHFADVGLRDTHVGTTAAVSSGVDKVHGKVIGYSAATGTFDAKSQQFRIQIAIALKGGIVVLAFSQG